MSSAFESIVSRVISDTPSGEIKEVYQDLITIAGENSQNVILEAIEQYNIKNTIPVDVNGSNVILSSYNKEGSKFFDPAQSIIFSVDHLNRKGLDIAPYQGSELKEIQQGYLQELNKYVEKNFTGQASVAVYPIPQEESKTAIVIVSTKYNPGNFWNGAWKSEYVYDSRLKQLKGFIDVQVHYYEDGNVSFKSRKDVEIADSESPIKSIQQVETEFESNLDVSFTELNERQFKQLRRRLPITRSRVNWGKAIGNYRLGRDAAQGKPPQA
ncbi:F-actin-capping protein subunit alpha [Zygosaccharomyces mellis]|uniref:F-actin-capping protein subunit alpha n=1 Tax=Zygosaccharomyces mellis TaxID=42258 RepID=A0A4C2E9E9_9SACH|nr:F-actin-capping protein subunit alpha [Zygosaccharomyces mellis]